MRVSANRRGGRRVVGFTLVELPAVSMRERAAFTLVELLVVIGIIAVLISILLPSLARARQQAVSAQCMSNLRQVGQAIQMYAGEYKGWYPLGQGASTANGTLEKFLDYAAATPANPSGSAVRDAMAKYLGAKPPQFPAPAGSTYVAPPVPVLYCPADDQNVSWQPDNFLAKGTGSGQNEGKFKYWYVANPWFLNNEVATVNTMFGGDPDRAAASTTGAKGKFAHMDRDPDQTGPATDRWRPSEPCKPGVDYLRKASDKRQQEIAVMVDRSKQQQAVGGWFYMHGNPSKKASAWKNELFGDGHCEPRRADQMRQRWSELNPAAW